MFQRVCGLLLLGATLAATGCADGGTGGSEGTTPESVIAKNILGTAYLGQQKWAEAEAAFLEAVSEVPDENCSSRLPSEPEISSTKVEPSALPVPRSRLLPPIDR